MTVKELIEVLKMYPENYRVVLSGDKEVWVSLDYITKTVELCDNETCN